MKKASAALLIICIILTSCAKGGEQSESRIRYESRIPVTVSTPQSENNPSQQAEPSVSNQESPVASQAKPPEGSSSKVSADSHKYKVLKTYNAAVSATSGQLSYETPVIGLAANGTGKLAIYVENSSAATSLTVSFITRDDRKYTFYKSMTMKIDAHSASQKLYIADISSLYGYVGILYKIKIVSSVVYDGQLKIKKIELLDAADQIAPFSVSEKKIITTRSQLKAMTPGGASYYPDGIIGVLKNPDGTFNFFSSSPLKSAMKSVTAFSGSIDNPFQKLVFADGEIIGTPDGYGPDQFNYCSVGQIYRFSGSECFTIVHLERHFGSHCSWDKNGVRDITDGALFMVASLALGYSPDNGQTWYYAGEIARHECESIDRYYGIGKYAVGEKSYSRDIGNGAFVIKDGFIYVYYMDYDKNYTLGMGVLRAKLANVITAARAKSTAKQTALFKKYYMGGFTESAFNGKHTSIIDEATTANFLSVIYSKKLGKYVMARTVATDYVNNSGDIVINVSDDPVNFKGNNYYIDAAPTGEQYPTLLGTGSDPGFTSDSDIYLYYITAEVNDTFLWNKANIAQRIIKFN